MAQRNSFGVRAAFSAGPDLEFEVTAQSRLTAWTRAVQQADAHATAQQNGVTLDRLEVWRIPSRYA